MSTPPRIFGGSIEPAAVSPAPSPASAPQVVPQRAVGPRVCAHHPDRAAHALCVGCRAALCSGCATTWEGINLCASCLAVRRRGGSEASGWRSGFGALGLVINLVVGLTIAAVAATFLRAWVGALLVQLQ